MNRLNNESSPRFLSRDNEDVYRDRAKLSDALRYASGVRSFIQRELDGVINLNDLPSMKAMTNISMKAQRHLWDLDTRCISFLEWQEFVPNERAISQCI